jgi:transcription termination factor Rho
MANAIAENHPEVTIIVADRRAAGEVTEMIAAPPGRSVARPSTREPPDVQVSDMVLEKAKRLVEHGKDAVILLDSLTRFARAHNTVAPQSGKILSGGVDASAHTSPRGSSGRRGTSMAVARSRLSRVR